MDLWIRSQDRLELMPVDKETIYITKNMNRATLEKTYYININELRLGSYKNEERALHILDEIHFCLLGITMQNYIGEVIISKETNKIVYTMPKE